MNGNGFPVIKIEMEGISYHVRQAFLDRMDELKAYANRIIDASFNKLSEGGLETAIIKAVERTMDEAINSGIKSAVSEAVSEYFENGRGKEFILRVIQEHLERR